MVRVTADTRRVQGEPLAATLYRPLRQNPPMWMYIMVRTRTDSVDITREVRQAVQSIERRQPIEGPYIIAEWVSDMTAPLRFVVVVGVGFSVVAVLLAFAGVYALTADLSQRAIREIGIRKALGATTAEILGLYLLRVARPAIPALIAGALVGVAVLRVLANQIENVSASQLWVPVVVICGFGALIAVSTLLASRSAARVNPAISMRAE